jgi:hypothetical protein
MAYPYDPRGLTRASESATALLLLRHLKLGRDDPHDSSVGIPQFDCQQGHISLFSKDRFLSLIGSLPHGGGPGSCT